ncbi:Hypothetical predicted protein [Paramuricea clavata]|uniref:Uncharacterized protein n=1 Tax=Paramuricea clavata TaxID=317549 RepID=A0A6S7GZX2_PARCT|nr:Hypothetical predicted protein [Paramuricea clavata]
MVGVYGFIFVSFIVTIIMLRLQRDNYFYFADVFYSYTEWLVWFSGPSFFFLLYYMRFTLYRVLIAELVISLCALLLKKCFSFSKKMVFKLTSFDKILERHSSASSPDQKTPEIYHHVSTAGLRSRDEISNQYHMLPQNEDINAETSVLERSRTCFPGKIADSGDRCPKRKMAANRET